jgi:phage portal protein BeeE
MSLQQWCRVFGLPQVLFDTDTTSYNNYQNALRDMMTNTIIPLCSTLRDELNRWLLPIYGEDVYIDFDITSIPEMQQDMERMTRVLRDANWLTMDEKRVAMNYEPKFGAYEYSYVNQGLVVLDQVAMDLTYDDTNGSDNMDSSDDTISQDREREEMSSGEGYDEQGS